MAVLGWLGQRRASAVGTFVDVVTLAAFMHRLRLESLLLILLVVVMRCLWWKLLEVED